MLQNKGVTLYCRMRKIIVKWQEWVEGHIYKVARFVRSYTSLNIFIFFVFFGKIQKETVKMSNHQSLDGEIR